MNFKRKKKLYLLLIIISFIISISYNINYKITKSELNEVSVILSESPKFTKGKSSVLAFKAKNDKINYFTDNLSNHFFTRDSINILFKKDDELKFLVYNKVDNPFALFEYFSGRKTVYGVVKNGRNFIELKEYNSDKFHTIFWPYAISFVLLICYIVWSMKNVEQKKNIL